jgi:NAD/NADP octopine/nopaline dehydrogenase, alpha-helical domain
MTHLSGGTTNGTPLLRRSLAICGGGNAAHALAVVASQTFEGDIDWLVGSEEKARVLRQRGTGEGLRSTGVISATAGRLRTISADPSEVIPHADLVVIVVPAFAHAQVLRRITPHLRDGALLGCMPTRGGFEFDLTRVAHGRNGPVAPTIFGLQTLPWSTRVKTLGAEVHIGALKQEVFLAALPAAQAPPVAEELSRILGTRVIPTHSFLGLTLGNPGQFIHSGLMYGHFHGWHGEEYGEDKIPMLYAEASDETGEIVEQLSDEAIAVARRIESESGGALDLLPAVLPIHDWLRTVYAHVTADTSSVATCFRTGPIQARKAPMSEVSPGKFVPNFSYRYLSEDVPFGLVATRALAEIAEVPTPTIDKVVAWAQRELGKLYLVEGALRGPDARELPIPQNYGIGTLPELISWYSDDHVRTRARVGSASL